MGTWTTRVSLPSEPRFSPSVKWAFSTVPRLTGFEGCRARGGEGPITGQGVKTLRESILPNSQVKCVLSLLCSQPPGLPPPSEEESRSSLRPTGPAASASAPPCLASSLSPLVHSAPGAQASSLLLHTPHRVLPEDLRTGCSLCVEHCSLRIYLSSHSPLILEPSSQMFLDRHTRPSSTGRGAQLSTRVREGESGPQQQLYFQCHPRLAGAQARGVFLCSRNVTAPQPSAQTHACARRQ